MIDRIYQLAIEIPEFNRLNMDHQGQICMDIANHLSDCVSDCEIVTAIIYSI